MVTHPSVIGDGERRSSDYLGNSPQLTPFEVRLGPCPERRLPLDPVGEERDRPAGLGQQVLVEEACVRLCCDYVLARD